MEHGEEEMGTNRGAPISHPFSSTCAKDKRPNPKKI